MSSKRLLRSGLIAACLFGATPVAFAADGEPWLVSKSSGEVWVATQGAAQVSLGREDALKPGDTIRTGPNGRVRLTRGAETMMIAPNSEVGLPAAAKDGMATTILQRAGSILLDVEKRNVQHFEVETPYLAAVVKGTQFSVTISGRTAKVEVSRGQVQVSDFKSGQIAQVLPGQAATAFANGRSGLNLSGSGTFMPIEQGRPRTPTLDRVPVPRDGLHAPREAKGSVIHALNGNAGSMRSVALAPQRSATTSVAARPNVVRISSSIGEVNLNINKATRGLAHGANAAANGAGRSTAWTDARGNSGNAAGNSPTTGGTAGDSSFAAALTAAVGSPSGSASANATNSGNGNSAGDSGGNGGGRGNGSSHGSNDSGNGNSGNGNGRGNSDNSNGRGNSGNGSSGHGNNGNGNSGNGNAYAYGHNKN
ncbi:FecR family protein [Bradyrhizobium sp. SRS-191]|uniref:FecR family protein n=1 Tax=Bradyrhizobium sp. SRS-191 TaxID=2962606 RepID=UPI00211DE411|nr:FecR family protein [Bradyrhizobium sp. SRS-191]